MPNDMNASIIDQHVSALAVRLRPEIVERIGTTSDEHRVKSAAFAMLCIQHALSLDEQTALDALTDGGNDAGIDALHIGDVVDGEFVATIVQSKYARNLEGKDGYPGNSIVRLVQTVQQLFDPDITMAAHPRLEEKVTEVRSLLLDQNLPEVQVLLCNNGKKWEANGEQELESSGLRKKSVFFTHINHDKLLSFLQKRKPVDAKLRLAGAAFVENYDFRRVLVGKLPVSEIKSLFDEFGDRLLDRNIRRYLGLRENRVNWGIHSTLSDPAKRTNFYFFNNGITAVCSKFAHTALQNNDWSVTVDGLQIVNGGQTCKTIQRALQDDSAGDYSKTHVLLRLYEIAFNDDDVVNNITVATNSQNPVDVADLHSNDPIQEKLGIGLNDLGFEYKRKRDEQATSAPSVITAAVAAESVMAVWKRKPNAAKFRRGRLFSDFYQEVFSDDLQASHVVISVLIFRLVENERKRPKQKLSRFVPYASHFIAMLIGDLLLKRAGLSRETVNHANISTLRTILERDRETLYKAAVKQVEAGLEALGIGKETPLPRIAAQFRRGDLLQQALSTRPTHYRKKAAPASRQQRAAKTGRVVAKQQKRGRRSNVK